jgi:hypothetical protein
MRHYLFSFITIVSLAFVVLSLLSNSQTKITTPTKPDQCMSCHQATSDMDASHPNELFGCYRCHGGNRYATNKEDAHIGIVRNPSRLEHAQRFCGDCHKDIIKRVNSSMMNTQNGILNVLKYQWGEISLPKGHIGIDDIRGDINHSSLAEDHFRKACASCHINQDESVFDDPHFAKGGGCADCHRSGVEKAHIFSDINHTAKITHPTFTTKIPSTNCLKCHNRSNRIGISYFGKFESEGYGTPYKNGEFSNRLDNHRFYYELPADIHHTSAKMECIDCHTEAGVMGDGKKHHHMEDAVDIACKDCHQPKFKEANALAVTLANTNESLPEPKEIAYTAKKDSPIYNLQKEDNSTYFYTKLYANKIELQPMSDHPYHTLAIHKRLDCSSCHSSWMPSCYGCHEVYFENGKQFDWVEKKMTKGEWQEYRSFLRFESPTLGIGYNEKIMPFAPGCQVIGTAFKDSSMEQFHAMAMAGWDPHTTQKSSRECIDCHFDPATLGLGRGNLDIKKDTILFAPFYNSNKSGMPFSYPIDGFVSSEGKQFQSTSRQNARSFNKSELEKIVNAYRCILCHSSYDDPIYKDFERSKSIFAQKEKKCFE